MSDFPALLASAETRPRALEVMLLAHVALNRTCLQRRLRPKVSRAARIVAQFVEHAPAGVPLSPEFVWVALHDLPDTLRAECAGLAEDAAALTVADLTFLSRETALRLLGALPRATSRLDRMLELEEDAAA